MDVRHRLPVTLHSGKMEVLAGVALVDAEQKAMSDLSPHPCRLSPFNGRVSVLASARWVLDDLAVGATAHDTIP